MQDGRPIISLETFEPKHWTNHDKLQNLQVVPFLLTTAPASVHCEGASAIGWWSWKPCLACSSIALHLPATGAIAHVYETINLVMMQVFGDGNAIEDASSEVTGWRLLEVSCFWVIGDKLTSHCSLGLALDYVVYVLLQCRPIFMSQSPMVAYGMVADAGFSQCTCRGCDDTTAGPEEHGAQC